MTDEHHRSKPQPSELPFPASAFEHFPMSKKNTVQDLSNLFVSPKTATGIPVPHSAIREALIQASLDPEVRAIEITLRRRLLPPSR
jgi:hypothetical protein